MWLVVIMLDCVILYFSKWVGGSWDVSGGFGNEYMVIIFVLV